MFQCRTRLCVWCNLTVEFNGSDVEVSMPHAALWVVQPLAFTLADQILDVSMPHAALWVVQQRKVPLSSSLGGSVSMPHAALWVVQLVYEQAEKLSSKGFQCRTRLCGWCNVLCTVYIIAETTPNDKCFPMQQKSRCMAAFLYLPSLSWMRGIIIFHRSKDKIN